MDLTMGYKFSDIKIRHLPQFTQFSVDLSTLLDQDHPTGRDFRLFLEYLGFYSSEIGFLASRVQRPTAEALRRWEGSAGELVHALRQCEREDAVNCVRRWLASHIRDIKRGGFGRVPDQCSPRHPYLQSAGYSSESDDLLTIEELLEVNYYPSEPARQISASFLIREEDTSPIRRSSEYLCNQFTSLVKGCILMPKDATWMTNSTVYVNNLARVYFVVMLFVNLVECLFTPGHQPRHVLEFFIALIPVWESIYVDKHVGPYKQNIKKIMQCKQEMEELQRALAHCVDRQHDSNSCTKGARPGADPYPGQSHNMRHPSVCTCNCECMRIYRQLQDVKHKEELYMHEAQPRYTDLRHCVFSALLAEIVIIVMILLHALCCETLLAFIHGRLQGFTSFAYILLFVDCFYNTVVIACYYSDSTPRTVVEKDRFRHRHEIVAAKASFSFHSGESSRKFD